MPLSESGQKLLEELRGASASGLKNTASSAEDSRERISVAAST